MDDETEQTRETITITVNGQARTAEHSSTVADMLQVLSITASYVVVQLDGVIVPRAEFAQKNLRDGSQMEIITLVGGG